MPEGNNIHRSIKNVVGKKITTGTGKVIFFRIIQR